MEDGPALLIAEIDIFKAHIAAQGRARAVLPQPIPALAILRAREAHLALVHLRRLAHGLKDALRAGQRRQQEVRLGGELVDGHGRLAHEHQIAGQAAHVRQSPQGEQSAKDGDDGVVDVGDGDHGGHHGGGVALRAFAGLAQSLVALVEFLQILVFMVEDLDHFLPADHFFDIAVQFAQIGLLMAVMLFAAPAAVANVEEHGQVTQHHEHRQPPVEDEKDHQRARHLDEALDEHGEAVVERVGDGVHVAGEIAHDVAMPAGIEKAQGQRLQMSKEVAADIVEHLLRGLDHRLRIAQSAERAHGIDAGGEDHPVDEGVQIAVYQIVDHGPDHVGAQKVAQGAERDQHGDQQEKEFVPPHIIEQLANRIAQVFRPGVVILPRHRSSLLSSARRRSPDRWDLWPAVLRACPRHGRGRRPVCRCDPPPSLR